MAGDGKTPTKYVPHRGLSEFVRDESCEPAPDCASAGVAKKMKKRITKIDRTVSDNKRGLLKKSTTFYF